MRHSSGTHLLQASESNYDPTRRSADRAEPFDSGPRRAHLVGIAGAGMQALAEVLLSRGWQLTGSDLAPERAAWLESRGIRVMHGHAADNLPDNTELLIHSPAVDPTVAERRLAARRGLDQWSYPEMLGRLMREGVGLAVAGTHGKSTVTAMATAILVAAGLDPTVVGGGARLGSTSGGRFGRGRHVLVEACEYRSHFLHLKPWSATLLGVEHDHFDYFDTDQSLTTAYERFVTQLPADGTLTFDASSQSACRAARAALCQVETFGYVPEAVWRADELRAVRGRYSFTLCRGAETLGRIALHVPGRFQVSNALAAASLTWHAGADATAILRGLAAFHGIARRMERLSDAGGIALWDDFAHHPTEVSATLAALREIYPNRRILCVFQPHQASRLRRLLDEFADSLHNADYCLVAEIYRARESGTDLEKNGSSDLARAVRARGGKARAVLDHRTIIDTLIEYARPDDAVVTLGAGDLWKVAHGFLDRIRSVRAAA